MFILCYHPKSIQFKHNYFSQNERTSDSQMMLHVFGQSFLTSIHFPMAKILKPIQLQYNNVYILFIESTQTVESEYLQENYSLPRARLP